MHDHQVSNHAVDLRAQFIDLVRRHDLTYNYSDDGAVWRRGQAQRDEILKLAKLLPKDWVAKTWNAEVDKKIGEGYREPFYW